MEEVAVVIGAIWLLVVTIALLLCIRQIGILMVRLDISARTGSAGSVGPPIGTSLPAGVIARVPELALGQHVAVVVSGGCDPCEELVDAFIAGELPTTIERDALLFLLVDQDVSSMNQHARLRDAGFQVVPGAADLARMIGMAHKPSAVLTENGVVAGTMLLHRPSELDRLTSTDRSHTHLPTGAAH